MAQDEKWTRVLTAASAGGSSRSENDMLELLDIALQLGPSITAHSVGCSITQTADVGFVTPAASNGMVLDLDLAQYALGEGPCLAACRDRKPYGVVVTAHGAEFPSFREAAAQLGVGSLLSLPLPNRRASALNLYAATADAFDSGHAKAAASLLTRCVSRLLPDRIGEREPDREELRLALECRETVTRAQRLLAEREQIDPLAAFDLMIMRSRARIVGLREIASEIVDGATS